MNSKERVLKAINHEEPDRVPVDYWAVPETTEGLCRYFNVQNLDEVLERLEVDLRYVKPSCKDREFGEQPDGSLHRKTENGEYVDIWGVVRKEIVTGKSRYLEVEKSPLSEAATVGEVEKCKFPDPNDFDYLSVNELCRGYENYAVVCTGDRLTTRASIFKLAMYLRGMDKLFMDMALNPEIVHSLVDRLLQFHLEHNRRIFEAASEKIDIFMLGDDFGAQNGLLISLDMFREFFKAGLKKLIDLGHSYGIKVMLHSCGGIKALMPDLIEIGLDILNPVQTRARDMVPGILKKEFGSYLSFHGSLDVQQVLPFGTVEEIECEVRRCTDELGPGGGFILAPAHNIQPDTPVRNIVALYESARKYGNY